MAKAQQYVDQARRFVREFTEGLNVEDMRRLFDQDATQAYKVLARDRPEASEPTHPLKRLIHRAKVIFLGVSSKLTPARRAIFAVSLLMTLIGVINPTVFSVDLERGSVHLDFSALWFLIGVAGLLYLLVVELVDRIKVRDELEVARHLQRDLLPKSSPDLAGYEFAHSYRTANAVGGDYYDFQLLPDGRLTLAVGDASGHGIAAGLLMAIANATLKTALDIDPTPQNVANLLNRALFRTGDRRAFMTLFFGVLEPDSGRFEFICAGHPFPLLRRENGRIEELGTGTLPLGLRKSTDLPTESTTIQPGDLLLLFSDGLPEAVDSVDTTSAKAFGFDTIQRLLKDPGSPQAVHDRILLAFDSHTRHQPLTDDLTLVAVGRG